MMAASWSDDRRSSRRRSLQTGSQQRSSKPRNTFRVATEAVRNGRIGRVHTVKIGIGQDQPKGVAPKAQPVPASGDHYRDWLEAIVARRDPIAPVDQSARSLEACAAAWIAMKLQRTLTWDPKREAFVNDAEANAMRGRTPRSAAYDVGAVMKRAGL